MAKFALLVELKAKPGKESEIEAFLEKEATLVRGEPGMLSWHAAKIEGEPGVYRIFDTFDNEVAWETHLSSTSRPASPNRKSLRLSLPFENVLHNSNPKMLDCKLV